MKKLSFIRCSSFLIVLLIVVNLCCSSVLTIEESHENELSVDEVKAAVETWVRYDNADARPNVVVERMEAYIVDGKIIAYIAHLKDGGFCICGADKLLLPVYLYCPSGVYDPDVPDFQYFLSEIENIYNYLNEDMQKNNIEILKYQKILDERDEYWDKLISGYVPKDTSNEEVAVIPEVIKLDLKSHWDQYEPYNKFCPPFDPEFDKYPVGCAGLATAQIMNFWKWPPNGVGNIRYQTKVGDWIDADFSDKYDWDNILFIYKWDEYSEVWVDENGKPLEEGHIDAVAELCFEVAAAVRTQFIEGGSGLYSPSNIISALIFNFTYGSYIIEESFDLDKMINEIQWFRPIICYAFDPIEDAGHTWVIHGYDTTQPGATKFLMNMGWGNKIPSSVWYTIDEIYLNGYYLINRQHHFTIIAPNNVKFARSATWEEILFSDFIYRDGTPSDPYLFINEAIDNTPADGTLVFKADSYMTPNPTEYYKDILINKPITLKGHEVIIQTRMPRNRVKQTPFLNFIQKYLYLFPILTLLLHRFGLQ